ncbi:hypothetical protein [Trueperella sp.]|uniref:hypothetical protein n=1 Tax=Trueperella sp. TaxID=2699835 RepID=UPI0022EB5FE4|nr:hypothetical protein [Trueperella sp.]
MKYLFRIMTLTLVSLLGVASPSSPAALDAVDGLSCLTVVLPHGNPYDDDAPGPLDGYTVTLSRANIDTTTPEGYTLALEAARGDLSALTVVKVGEKVTGADGVVVFDGLAPALYVVEAALDRPGSLKLNEAGVVLPADNEGTWVYGVILRLKETAPGEPTPPQDIPNPSPGPTPAPHKPGGKLEWTGANMAGPAAVAVALLLGGAALHRRNRKLEK